jgi:purine-binding chemotaxis protein CheW
MSTDTTEQFADTSEFDMGDDFLLSGSEKKRLLKERALALAGEAAQEEDESQYVDVLEFLLAHERYAIELTHIQEVCQLSELTPVPGTPSFVLGVINVRSRILSIIDLKKFFDLPEKGITNLNKVIILSSPEMEFGILADSILGARSILAKSIQESLPTLTGIRTEFLKGVTGDRVVVLDGEKILSEEKILVK